MTEWISIHVFYAGNPTPMLTECIRPLIGTLRQSELIDRHFFIRYWLEGPHVRLRLHPAPGAEPAGIRQRAEAEIGAFLQRKPALYAPHYPGVDEVYQQLGVAEYGEKWWTERFGVDGPMTFRPNNSLHYIDYEPENERYGGPAGVDLAEWHFEQSSDLVLEQMAAINVHVQPVLLGLSAQLALALGLGFLGTPQETGIFFGRYRGFWESAYTKPGERADARYERGFVHGEAALVDRIASIVDGAADGSGKGLGPAGKVWLEHGKELSARVRRLFADGSLTLRERTDGSAVANPQQVYMLLLSSYLHMTNNRLGVGIPDEIYLSYLLERGLAVAVSAR